MSTDGNGVEAIGFQLGDISCIDAMGLNAVDVYDEGLLVVRWVSSHQSWVWRELVHLHR
jgi:hypothetical protein